MAEPNHKWALPEGEQLTTIEKFVLRRFDEFVERDPEIKKLFPKDSLFYCALRFAFVKGCECQSDVMREYLKSFCEKTGIPDPYPSGSA